MVPMSLKEKVKKIIQSKMMIMVFEKEEDMTECEVKVGNEWNN